MNPLSVTQLSLKSDRSEDYKLVHSASLSSIIGTIPDRVWCSGNIVDSHFLGVTAFSTAPGSTPGIRVTTSFFVFFLSYLTSRAGSLFGCLALSSPFLFS